jgi:hypothetical protein
MKTHSFWHNEAREGTEVIALFGGAELVRHLDGTCEIVGGSGEDRDAARDWIALYLHSVVLREPSGVCPVSVAQPDWRPTALSA